MQSFFSLMGTQKILPIIQPKSVEEAVHVARAMKEAGLNLVEVVLRSPASLDAIAAIKTQVPGLIVGAGTILNEDILNQALAKGIDFVVTPAITPKLLEALVKCPVPVIPGVSNTADIALAHESGFREMKLFPASLCGGIPFLKAVSSVFQDVKFCPTGGVNQENMADFLALNNVNAVGGTWVANSEWIAAQDWQKITNACELANK